MENQSILSQIDENPAQKEFLEIMSRKEDLHPELQKYLEDSAFGKSLRHPLVFSIFYHEGMNALLNMQYQKKLEYIEKAKSEKNWSSYFFMYERPYRMQKFMECCFEMDDKDYWTNLGSIWTDSENLWQYRPILDILLNSSRPGREQFLMNEKEKVLFDSLPDTIKIYRGHHKFNRIGHSWTLSYFKAKWFASRWDMPKNGVVSAQINKKDAFALLLGRGEFEIVTTPDRVAKSIKPVGKLKRPAWLEAILKEVSVNYRKGGLHGLWHWEKVERNAIELAKRTPGAEMAVVRTFALLHDSCRLNDDDDPEHGHRAADLALKLKGEGKLKLNDRQLNVLIEACRYHNDGQISKNASIGVCWDADRLDLTRVGIAPDPNLLSTKAGKELIWNI